MLYEDITQVIGRTPVIRVRRLSPPASSTAPSATRSSRSSDAEAIGTARDLGREEGILCGISAGGSFTAGLAIAKRAHPDEVILAMLPNTKERYLSTALLEGIETGSDTI